MSIMYSPENYGVKVVDDFEVFEPDYSFDIVLVVKDSQTGKVFAAFDSGCSCPTPFEDHSYPSDFIEVRAWADVRALIEANRLGGYRWPNPIPASFRNRVLEALRRVELERTAASAQERASALNAIGATG